MAPSRMCEPQGVSSLAAKRRKLSPSASQLSQGYNSQEDSGDELFNEYDTVETVPWTRPQTPPQANRETILSSPAYVTQPTQIIDKPAQTPDSTTRKSSVVQVAASSPFRPADTTQTTVTAPTTSSGGILANAMAPAGTAFRPPFGIRRAPPKQPVIDISDDDGPTYHADSSSDDADTSKTADIKPSTFAKGGRTISGGDGATDRIEDSPSASLAKFQQITSQSFYNPGDKSNNKSKSRGSTLSGSVFDSRNRDESNKSSRTATTRPPNQGRQTGPAKAMPVEDITIADITDYYLRQKIIKIRNVFPTLSITSCKTALLTKKGNFDDALELVASQLEHNQAMDLTLSDDERQGRQQRPGKTLAKQQVKAPIRSIQDKWSSTQGLPAQTSPVRPTPKPRRKLVQGRKAPSSSAVESPKPLPTRTKSPVPDDEDSDSGVASLAEEDTELDRKVLSFFNTCSAKDLADISNTTQEIASVILSQKPFSNLEEIRQITAETTTNQRGKRKATKRTIGDKIVDICVEMWAGYEAVDELVYKCEALGKPVAEEMKKWGFDVFGAARNGELEMVSLEDARDSGVGTPSSSTTSADDEVDEQVKGSGRPSKGRSTRFIQQPSIMSKDITLKDYQIVGLNWLALLFEKNLSCILADEMGLGKTCQVISFLAHLYQTGIKGPHLVIVPGSTLENWLIEFQNFCPELVVEPYYGLQNERFGIRENIEANRDRINVIVTTYDMATNKDDSKFLRRQKPVVCVYDEGHLLKNSQSKRYEQLMRIPARFRLLLTGTPLQNNLEELAALLGFILPAVFKERAEDLKSIFKHKASTTDESHAALLSAQRIARAKSMMTPFVLRRKKHQVLKHLPKKTCLVEYCDMTEAQAAIYFHEQAEAREAIAARAAGKKPEKDSSANVMMQLRKAAIHPLLFRRLYTDDLIRKMSRDSIKESKLRDSDPDIVYEEMEFMSDFQLHKLCEEYPTHLGAYALKNSEWMDSGKINTLAPLLRHYQAHGDRALCFSQFTLVLDILEQVLQTLDIPFFRLDGQTPIAARQTMIDEFNTTPSITVFLLSTKAGGSGINLASANKVVIFDQSFNPQEDVQAENRAHRVGQLRAVEVTRLVVRGTVEERILRLGGAKMELDDRVSGEGGLKGEGKSAKEVEAEVEKLLIGEIKGEVDSAEGAS
ncbi:MAG: hypothetical protein M1819_002806 [Sarea resinae]|nr:MAG: hypothetical protein M1819_002806 [Sarea resinae]